MLLTSRPHSHSLLEFYVTRVTHTLVFWNSQRSSHRTLPDGLACNVRRSRSCPSLLEADVETDKLRSSSSSCSRLADPSSSTFIMTPHKRGPWSPGEDSYLLQLVHTQGAHNWVRISHLIRTRSPKQCRERFHQNLKPTLNHEPITPEEGILIERLVTEMGKRWAEIARRLDGRSDNAVKNWWNGGMNRRRRLVHRRGDHARSERQFDERSEARSFARPAPSYEHSIHATSSMRTTLVAPRPIHFDTPLPSPSAMSDVSRADSADGVPSLMSDSLSTYSTSPRFPQSPPIELAPLLSHYALDRRPSWPTMHLGPNNTFMAGPEFQQQHQQQQSQFPHPSFETRAEIEQKVVEYSPSGLQQSTFRRPSLPVTPAFGGDEYRMRYSAGVPLTSPTAQPSRFQELAAPTASTPAEMQDRRMNVSNLLG